MAASLSDSIVQCRAIQREFARRTSATTGEMHETSIKTREVIARSHDALAQADLLLAATRRMLNQNRP
jgi:hypothetical protein